MSEENINNTNSNSQELPKGLSVAGMVLGICGCVFSLISCTWFIGLPLAIIGVILSGIAMKKCGEGKADGKGMAIAGLATSIVGIVWIVIMFAFIGAAASEFDDAMDDYQDSVREFERLYDKYSTD